MAKKPFIDSVGLPTSYNRTNLTLIARDPHWIYAYWEVSASSIEAVRDKLGTEFDRAVRILRLYDVTYINFNGSNAVHQFDIDVGLHTSNWYINLWNDNVSYCADLGFRLPDGSFLSLARSNFVTTPRLNSSNRREEIWMKPEENKGASPYVFGEVKKNSRKRMGRAPARTQASRRRKITLTEDDVRSYYSNISPLLKDIISQRLSKTRTAASALRRQQDLNVVLRGSGPNNFFAGRFNKKTFLGASEFGGASEAFPGASERSDVKGRKFFFELGTELIVYGRTEPDAKVWWGDKLIELRGDGTFGMRLALPDGRIPLGFTAVSGDNVEKRDVSTGVEREKTRYA